MNNNYYDVLGISYRASNDDIKRAYRKLSLIYHPDKDNNDDDKTIKFQQLNEAYNTLSENILRDKYNRQNNINVENNIQDNNDDNIKNNNNFNASNLYDNTNYNSFQQLMNQNMINLFR